MTRGPTVSFHADKSSNLPKKHRFSGPYTGSDWQKGEARIGRTARSVNRPEKS